MCQVQVAEGPSWDGVDGDLSLAVNWTGVYVLTLGRVLHEISYPEITSISGDRYCVHMLFIIFVYCTSETSNVGRL